MPPTVPTRPRVTPQLFAAVDGALELRLRHLRTALDAHLLRFVVELLLGAPLRAVRAGPEPAAAARGDVPRRRPGRRLRLAAPRALLVDGARRDLLRPLLRGTPLLEALLDVLVLPLALSGP